MGCGEGHCLLFRDKGERKISLTNSASLSDMPVTKAKPEHCSGRLSQNPPGRHGAAHPLCGCVQLRRDAEDVSHQPCCCFPVGFPKHLYLARQRGPLWLLFSQTTVPMCQFARRGTELCARLWLEGSPGAGLLWAPPLRSSPCPTSQL